jgi:diaminopimelate decarboxylase
VQRVEPYVEALQRVAAFVDGAPERGEGIAFYDLGGGFGIGYGKGDALDVGAVATALLPTLRQRGWRPVVEPGRYLVGDAGVLLTRMLGAKRQGPTDFVLVDAAMNDLMRPALYDAWHDIVPVVSRDVLAQTWELVGPVCESGDFLGHERDLAIEPGDLLAVLSAGAYGMAMSSNYNTRRRAAEVLIDGSRAHLIRQREHFDSLWSDERLLP